MDASPRDLRPSPTAQQVADRLRSGVTARLAPHEAATPDGDLATLQRAGDLEGLRVGAHTSVMAPAVRAARRVLQVLLRPWFAAQTACNRELSRYLADTAAAARSLERRVGQMQQSLHALERRVVTLEAAGDPIAVRPDSSRVRADLGALAWMFLHSRLPRPPASVLALGPARVADLLSLGFDVFTVDATDPLGPRLHRSRGSTARLPFRDAAFDAVLVLPAAGADLMADSAPAGDVMHEAARVLRPGGRLLLTAPRADSAWRPLLDQFATVDVVAATDEGDVQILTPDGGPAVDGVAPRALCICAERRDASRR